MARAGSVAGSRSAKGTGVVAARTPSRRSQAAAAAPAEAKPARTKSASAKPATRRVGHVALIKRMIRAIEAELTQIETILLGAGAGSKPPPRSEAERRARTLASLARTLAEMRRLYADEHNRRPAHDDDSPGDLDDFRRTLWKRLEAIASAASAASDAGDVAR